VFCPSDLPLQNFAALQVLVGLLGRLGQFAMELREEGWEFLEFLLPGFAVALWAGHGVYAAASHIRLNNQNTKNSPTRPRTSNTT
jgi:hypothetical protein